MLVIELLSQPVVDALARLAGVMTPAGMRPMMMDIGAASPPRKHPRSRGKRSLPDARTGRRRNTPPLTRGKLSPDVDAKGNTPAHAGKPGIGVDSRGGDGNTPAYAGKTKESTICRRALRKHPRLRGENEIHTGHATWGQETPPLTRGKLFSGERWILLR